MNTSNIYDDVKAAYTSKAPSVDGLIKPDLFTPGSNIIAPLSPQSTVARQSPDAIVNGNYISLSGTSMATGIASGAAALILQAYPAFSPEVLKLHLLQNLRMFTASREGALHLQQVFREILST